MRIFRTLVTSLILSERCLYAFMKSGIQHNVTFASLAEANCSMCYYAKYPSRTTSANVTSCAGPFLFVGMRSLDAINFTSGAYAAASEVQKPTPLNSPHLSNGVYWYFTEGEYFGFLSSPNMSLTGKDVDVFNPNSTLLWSIGLARSHLRSRALEINETLHDEKWIFSCPASHDEATATGSTTDSTYTNSPSKGVTNATSASTLTIDPSSEPSHLRAAPLKVQHLIKHNDPITIILIASMAVIGVFISLVALCLGNNAYRESTLQLFGSLCSPEKRDELGYFCCECVRLTTLFVLVIMISPFLVTVYLCSCRSCFSRRSDSVCSEESVVVVEAGAITCCQ